MTDRIPRPLRCLLYAWMALSLALCVPGCNLDVFQSPASLRSEVLQALEARNFSTAATAAQKLVEKLPEDHEAYFLLAQAKAQAGDRSAAIVALEQAIKKGLRDDAAIENNKHLDPVKSMAAYGDLMRSSFPGRHAGPRISASGLSAGDAAASVSIQEADGKQVLRAGDVVIEIPAGK